MGSPGHAERASGCLRGGCFSEASYGCHWRRTISRHFAHVCMSKFCADLRFAGAALATLVSPEPSGHGQLWEALCAMDSRSGAPDRRSSVFSGRFMPLSLWAQAESGALSHEERARGCARYASGATSPASGPGSPEPAKDSKETAFARGVMGTEWGRQANEPGMQTQPFTPDGLSLRAIAP